VSERGEKRAVKGEATGGSYLLVVVVGVVVDLGAAVRALVDRRHAAELVQAAATLVRLEALHH